MIKEKKEEEYLPKKKFTYKKSSTILFGGLILFAVLYMLFSALRSVEMDLTNISIFNTVFNSILMQAFPFMLIGVLVSSAMHIFVPDEWIIKIFPKKYGFGFVTALFAGLFFPVCECAIVPVMTRLIKKGVPMPIAITFMLSAPIINPIVIISTLYAFPDQPEITVLRVCLGLLIALMIGLVMMVYGKNLPMLLNASDNHDCNCHCDDVSQPHSHECSCHSHDEEGRIEKGLAGKFKAMLLHAGDEFFSVGKYLILGAFIASLMQALIPREIFVSLGSQSGFSILVMMLLAFLFSACSTSDAFIARSFMNKFSLGSIMGFLVFGPMMDIKNLLMLLANFRKGFVIRLSLLIVILNFLVLSFLTFFIL